MSGIGHNGGPSVSPGASWRTQCWRAARAELLPRLPIEVVRLRVTRAREIGLDYKTYAGVRAATGHDIVAFLFSTNALRLLREGQELDRLRAQKLERLQGVGRMLAAYPPLDPARLGAKLGFDHADAAPPATLSWGQTRARIRAMLAPARLPADRVLVIGDTGGERGWAEAARMAGYLNADDYFPQAGA